jgi:GTP-binding protein EngB required for normal cell division
VIDIKELAALVNKYTGFAREAIGKRVVMVLGQTGSGKSTLINYLLSFPMKRYRGHAIPVGDNALPPAAMGDTARSVTRCAQLYKGIKDLTYCDCPGFDDTAGDEHRIANSVMIESIIRQSKEVSSVVVLVDFRTFNRSQLNQIQNTAQILGEFFNRGNVPLDSLLFAFNRVDSDYDEADVKETVQALLEFIEKRLEEERLKLGRQSNHGFFFNGTVSSSAIASYESTSRFLKIILQSKVLLIDVFDRGASKSKLEKFFLGATPIVKSAFCFSAINRERDLLLVYIKQKWVRIEELVKRRVVLQWKINGLTETADDIKAKRAGFLQHISQLTQTLRSTEESRELKISHYRSELQAFVTVLHMLCAKKSEIEYQRQDAVAKLEQVDTGESVYYARLYASDWSSGLRRYAASFDYNDIPYKYASVDRNTWRGEYSVHRDSPSSGVYSARYRSTSSASIGGASVSIYVSRRDLPENHEGIVRLKSRISELESRLLTLRNIIANNKRDTRKLEADEQRLLQALSNTVSHVRQSLQSAELEVEAMAALAEIVQTKLQACEPALITVTSELERFSVFIRQFQTLYENMAMPGFSVPDCYATLSMTQSCSSNASTSYTHRY